MDWAKESGTREDILTAIRLLLEKETVLEVGLERELVNIYDGPFLLETAPTGRLRVELIFSVSKKENKHGE